MKRSSTKTKSNNSFNFNLCGAMPVTGQCSAGVLKIKDGNTQFRVYLPFDGLHKLSQWNPRINSEPFKLDCCGDVKSVASTDFDNGRETGYHENIYRGVSIDITISPVFPKKSSYADPIGFAISVYTKPSMTEIEVAFIAPSTWVREHARTAIDVLKGMSWN